MYFLTSIELPIDLDLPMLSFTDERNLPFILLMIVLIFFIYRKVKKEKKDYYKNN